MLVHLRAALLWQLHTLPHWDRCCRSNFLPHHVTIYWHRAYQSQRWSYNAKRLAGQPLKCQLIFSGDWYDSTRKNPHSVVSSWTCAQGTDFSCTLSTVTTPCPPPHPTPSSLPVLFGPTPLPLQRRARTHECGPWRPRAMTPPSGGRPKTKERGNTVRGLGAEDTQPQGPPLKDTTTTTTTTTTTRREREEGRKVGKSEDTVLPLPSSSLTPWG